MADAVDTATPTEGAGVVALADCRVLRPGPVEDHVEIVSAGAARRSFPPRVSTSLGICLKSGPAHNVVADGRRLVYPADGICVRAPGCVWSSQPGVHGFVSVDISPAGFEEATIAGSMAFLPRAALAGFPDVVHSLATADSVLQAEEITMALVSKVLAIGALQADVPRDRGLDRRAVERAREYLHAHHAGKPTLAQVADAAAINKFVLLRQFRRTLHTTPHAYLVMIRTERVKQLLTGGASLSEAAVTAGFCDQSHMGRWFKRACGITPAAYARELRARPSGSIAFQTGRQAS